MGLLLTQAVFVVNMAWSWLRLTVVLGAAFLALQGFEWARPLRYGLTAASSVYGGFFYVIVGTHGLHVLAGLGLLAWVLRRPDGEARLPADAAPPSVAGPPSR